MLNRQTHSADRRPHRRRAAAGLALRLPARGHYATPGRAAQAHRIALDAAGPAGGADDHCRRHRLVFLPARLGPGGHLCGQRVERLDGRDLRRHGRRFRAPLLGTVSEPGLDRVARVRRRRSCCSALRPSPAANSPAKRSASPTSSTTWCLATRSWPTTAAPNSDASAKADSLKAASGPRPTSASTIPRSWPATTSTGSGCSIFPRRKRSPWAP